MSTESSIKHETTQRISRLIRARYPIITVVSHEENRVQDHIQKIAEEQGKTLFTWTVNQGLRQVFPEPEPIESLPPNEQQEAERLIEATKDPVGALRQVLVNGEPTNDNETGPKQIYLFKDLHSFLTGERQDPVTVRALRDVASVLVKRHQTCILLSPAWQTPTDAEKDIVVVDFPLPTSDELGRAVDQFIANLPNGIESELNGGREKVIRALQGLTAVEADAVLAQAVIAKGHLSDDAIPFILNAKAEIIRNSGALEYYPEQAGYDEIGGLDLLKEWCAESEVAFSDAAAEYGVEPDKGVLIVGVPGCIRGDSRVMLADGQQPTIESLARNVSDILWPGEYPVAIPVLLETGETAIATKLQIHANRHTKKIRFTDGRELEATGDHQVLTDRGWVRCDNLRAGDKVRHSYVEDTPMTPQTRRTLYSKAFHARNHENCTPVDLPEVYTDELCELLGIISAEGCSNTYRLTITICNDEEDLKNHTRWLINHLFGTYTTKHKPNNKNVLAIRVNSLDIAYNLRDMMIEKSRTKTVPNNIFLLPEEMIGAYLRGLFEGDGTVAYHYRKPGYRGTPRLSLTSASPDLVRGAQLLMDRLGIRSKVYLRTLNGCPHNTLEIVGKPYLKKFQEKVGFISTEKRTKLQRGIESLKRNHYGRDIEWSTVETIEDGYLDRVYDLTVPGADRFIANGLVVHNCGKSLTAKAIAGGNRPLLRLDVGALFGSLVGQSEQQTRNALKVAEAVAPCVLWIDEIEKALGSGGGELDGGTSVRVLGTILTWMQETKAPVFVVATANDIGSLRPELIRRFSEVFFVDLPQDQERADILQIHMEKRGRKIGKADTKKVVKATEDFTGSEIEKVVQGALRRAFADGEREVTVDDLLHQAGAMVPLATTMEKGINDMRSWAVRARPASSRQETGNKKAAEVQGRALEV
jgi:ATP-dependent 26S proteasome regulatory subunit